MQMRQGERIARIKLHAGRPRKWLPHGWVKWVVWIGRTRFTLTGKKGKGIHIDLREHFDFGSPPKVQTAYCWSWPKMKKRVAAKVMGDATHLAPMESNRFQDMMSLVEHMATRKYDDGDPRETGWITIKTQGAAWCVQVKDPDSCASFTAVGETLDKALETAALLLSCDEAPWEPDTFLTQAAARRKKK